MLACVDNLSDMYPQTVRETESVGLVDGVNEDCLGVADRPTSHRCWPSRSAFQGWLCLDNTSQYRCWRWKPTELSEEDMFTAFVHCGALHGARSGARGRSWSWRACTEATVKRFLKAKFSSLRIYSTHGSWCAFSRVFHGMALLDLCLCLELSFNTFQVVVDDDELEMWLGWLQVLRIMRWELTRTGGLADIAFMVVDIVQRELRTDLFRWVRFCVAGLNHRMEIISARICNADHGKMLSKVEHVDMALTAGAAWAINCKA